jgi:hypothetical protein
MCKYLDLQAFSKSSSPHREEWDSFFLAAANSNDRRGICLQLQFCEKHVPLQKLINKINRGFKMTT